MAKIKIKKFRPASQGRSPLRMANFVLSFAIIGLLFVIFSAAAPTPGWYGSTENDQVYRINKSRAAIGKPAYQHIECLNSVAEAWTSKMVNYVNADGTKGKLYHNPNLLNDVIARCGRGFEIVGENVGVGGNWDSAALYTAFYNSPAHRANILSTCTFPNSTKNCGFEKVGVGAYVNSGGRLWVTQVFANCTSCSGPFAENARLPADPKPTATPTPTPPPPPVVTAPVCNRQINFIAPTPLGSYDGPTVLTTSTTTENRYYFYRYSGPSFNSHQIASINPNSSAYTHSDVNGNHGILMNYGPYFFYGINPARPQVNYTYYYNYSGRLYVKRVYKSNGALVQAPYPSDGGTSVTVPLYTSTARPFGGTVYGPQVSSPCSG